MDIAGLSALHTALWWVRPIMENDRLNVSVRQLPSLRTIQVPRLGADRFQNPVLANIIRHPQDARQHLSMPFCRLRIA